MTDQYDEALERRAFFLRCRVQRPAVTLAETEWMARLQRNFRANALGRTACQVAEDLFWVSQKDGTVRGDTEAIGKIACLSRRRLKPHLVVLRDQGFLVFLTPSPKGAFTGVRLSFAGEGR